jgi:hypothetical protein
MTDQLTTADIYRAFRDLPKIDMIHQRIRWVLSQQTCDAIAAPQNEPLREQGFPDIELPPGTPRLLLGWPVRIDDNTQGLDHEVIDR